MLRLILAKLNGRLILAKLNGIFGCMKWIHISHCIDPALIEIDNQGY